MHVHPDVRLCDRGGGRLPAGDEGFENVLRLERAVVHEDLADPARISQTLLLGREHDRVGIETPALDQRVEEPAADRPWRDRPGLLDGGVRHGWAGGAGGIGDAGVVGTGSDAGGADAGGARTPAVPPTLRPQPARPARSTAAAGGGSAFRSALVVLVAFRASLLDRGEDVSDRVDQDEKRARDVRVQRDLPFRAGSGDFHRRAPPPRAARNRATRP